MENPEYWGELEQRIHQVRTDWEKDCDDEVCGRSLERSIAEAVEEWIKEILDAEGTAVESLAQSESSGAISVLRNLELRFLHF